MRCFGDLQGQRLKLLLAAQDIARLSAEETHQAVRGVRQFRRLTGIAGVRELPEGTVLVDPPRAGLGPEVLRFVARFRSIVYISCSPGTLASNLQSLSETHDVIEARAFDQFPFTPHLEAAVLLTRKPAAR